MAAFTPLEAVIGGATLGLSSVSRMAVNGRITGHSGIVKGLLFGDTSLWRPVFLAGMAAGSIAAAQFIPGAFVEVPASFTVSRAVASGLLVGLGSGLGNGCTSGHGICGISRLSVRSMAYVATFMLSGAASASVSGITEAVGLSGIPTVLTPAIPAPSVLSLGIVLLASSVLVGLSLWAAGRKSTSEAQCKAVEMLTEGTSGAMFAAGLAYAGMTKASKVGTFLAITDKCWDPTLMFVMCGGILVTLPIFQAILHGKVLPKKPVCALKYDMPANNVIDAKLIVGGILFGAGWGSGGMCPGPAIANLAVHPLNPVNLGFFVAMLAGLALQNMPLVQGLFVKPSKD